MTRIHIVICIGMLFFSCSKSNTSTAGAPFFPQVPVNITLLLTSPIYTQLTFQPGNWIYEGGGYKGIIIYHTYNKDASSNDIYVAFDRTCPINPLDTCAFVSMDSLNIYFSCSKKHIIGSICNGSNAGICESTFFPDTGFPRSGTAKVPLKQYVVRNDGNYLYITNN